jgi:hypothetical protein
VGERHFGCGNDRFNDKNPVDYSQPHTEALRSTERYRRPDFGHIKLQVTIDDEFVCENERDVKHFVITGQKEIHLDSTLLSKYAETYERTVLGREPMMVTISVVGDQLIYESPLGTQTLFAQSETVFFSTSGAVIEFVNDGQGAVSHLIVHGAEGHAKAVRASRAATVPPR